MTLNGTFVAVFPEKKLTDIEDSSLWPKTINISSFRLHKKAREWWETLSQSLPE